MPAARRPIFAPHWNRRAPEKGRSRLIFTVGHGARSADDLVAILREAGIGTLVDVRAYPASRRHPQFSRDRLSACLAAAGIQYEWQGKALGGMRKSYADHMLTEEFQGAASALALRQDQVCIMCAESNPGDCHRSYIAEWLVAHGTRVMHLLEVGTQYEHAARLL